MHDDRRAELLGELRALVHVLWRRCRNVQVVALSLAGFRLGLLDRFHDEAKPVAPAHKGLRVDVLVVLGEIEPATQALVNSPAVVLRRQPELRLDRAAEHRSTVLVHLVALDLNAVRRSAAGHHIRDRKAHVFEAQGADRLEAEHVADQRGEHVDDRTLLEQIDGIGDKCVEAARVAGDVLDPVGTPLVMGEIGQQIGPHRSPGSRR